MSVKDRTNSPVIDITECLPEAGFSPERRMSAVTVLYARVSGPEGLPANVWLERHGESFAALVGKHGGTPIGAIGEGFISYFDSTADALATAKDAQLATERINVKLSDSHPFLMRVGLHTGVCSVGGNSIAGLPVRAALVLEALANPGEICLSSETYGLLKDDKRQFCRLSGTALVEGEQMDIYKAFWDSREMETEAEMLARGLEPQAVVQRINGWLRLALIMLASIAAIFLLSQLKKVPDLLDKSGDKRSYSHSAADSVGPGASPEVPRLSAPLQQVR